MSAHRGDLTADDVAWAVEVALSSHQERWVEHQITHAAGRDQAIDVARHILTSWGVLQQRRAGRRPAVRAGRVPHRRARRP